jgi:hypothetical protein
MALRHGITSPVAQTLFDGNAEKLNPWGTLDRSTQQKAMTLGRIDVDNDVLGNRR